MVYKILNNLAPEYLTNMLIYTFRTFSKGKQDPQLGKIYTYLVENITTCLLVLLPITGLCIVEQFTH